MTSDDFHLQARLEVVEEREGAGQECMEQTAECPDILRRVWGISVAVVSMCLGGRDEQFRSSIGK
jgi:hypothetical protein